MGFSSFFKKIGKTLKKVVPYVAPLAGLIPGVGSAVSAGLGAVGSLFGSSNPSPSVNSGQAGAMDIDMGTTTYPDQVNVTGQAPGFDYSKLIAPATGLIGGLVNYSGQQSTNTANAEQAQKQMDFQNAQTSTSYQRGVADMRAAGLNPMLAYSQGGAGSGTGAQAQMANPASGAVSSAFEGARTATELQAQKANIELTQAKTDETEANAENIRAQYSNIGASGKQIQATTDQVLAATKESLQRLKQSIGTNPDQADKIKYEAITQRAIAELTRLGIPKAKAQNTIWQIGDDITRKGSDLYKGIEPYLPDLSATANSARGAYDKARSFFSPSTLRNYGTTK